MAKIIRFPVERASRAGGPQSLVCMSVAWLPLSMCGYFWLYSTDAILTCWLCASGVPPRPAPRQRGGLARFGGTGTPRTP